MWWDAETHSIIPEGPAQPGQQIVAQTVALGKRWDVHITVRAATPEKHQLELVTRLPLGITVPEPHHLHSARQSTYACQLWLRLFNLTWMVGLGHGALWQPAAP